MSNTETAVQVKIGDHVGINGAEVLNLPSSDRYKSLYWKNTLAKCNKLLGKGNNTTLYLSKILGLTTEFLAENCIGVHRDIPNFDYVFTSYESTDTFGEYYEFNDYGLSLIFDDLSISEHSTESTEKILEDKYSLIFDWSLRNIHLLKSLDKWSKAHPREGSDCSGYVYVIQQLGIDKYYKIGKTKSIRMRLNSLETGSPTGYNVVYSAFVDDMDKVEKELHTSYSSKKVKGEWFILNKDDLKSIDKFLHSTD